MSKLVYLFLLLAGCSACGDKSVLKARPPTEYNILGDVSLASSRHTKLGIPTSNLPEILISRQQYLLSYNNKNRDLNWVAWELKNEDFGNIKRTDKFSLDPDLTFAHIDAVSNDEYINSCFDRGHQTPSADRTASQVDNEVTFYMSNMLPQTAYLNRVIWLSLENEERRIVREENKTIYIYAGPIFEKDKKIGPNKDIKVPTKNFKIIADEYGKVLAAAIMPNITSTGLDPFEDHVQACKDSHSVRPTVEKKANAWQQYKSSLMDIQKLSGIDFGFIND
jgi:endonuclease G